MDPIVVPALMLAVVGVVLVNRVVQARKAPPKALGTLAPYPELAGRLLEVRGLAAATRQHVEKHDIASLFADQLGRQADLVEAYARLAEESASLRGHLAANPPGAVDKALKRAHAGEKDAATQLLFARRDLLAKIAVASDSLRDQMKALEQAIRLVHDQAVMASTGSGPTVDVDRLTADVAAADAALDEVRALMRTTAATMEN